MHTCTVVPVRTRGSGPSRRKPAPPLPRQPVALVLAQMSSHRNSGYTVSATSSAGSFRGESPGVQRARGEQFA